MKCCCLIEVLIIICPIYKSLQINITIQNRQELQESRNHARHPLHVLQQLKFHFGFSNVSRPVWRNSSGKFAARALHLTVKRPELRLCNRTVDDKISKGTKATTTLSDY